MSRQCEICGKSSQTGNSVSHSHRATKRLWKPNLQNTTVTVNGAKRKMRVCTTCLKTGKAD